MPVHPLAIIAVIAASMLGAIGSLLFKYGSRKIKLKIKSILLNYNLILGLISAGLGAVLFIAALKFGDLSIPKYEEI